MRTFLQEADTLAQNVSVVRFGEMNIVNLEGRKIGIPEQKEEKLEFRAPEDIKKTLFVALLFGWKITKDNNNNIVINPICVYDPRDTQYADIFALAGQLPSGDYIRLGKIPVFQNYINPTLVRIVTGNITHLLTLYDTAHQRFEARDSEAASGTLIEAYRNYSTLQQELKEVESQISELGKKHAAYQMALQALEAVQADDMVGQIRSKIEEVVAELRTLEERMKQLSQEKQELEAQYKVFSDPDFERAVRVLDGVEGKLKGILETIVSKQQSVVETLSGVIGGGEEAVLETVRIWWDIVDPVELLRSAMGEEDFEQLSPEIRQLIVKEVQQLKQRMLEHQLSSMSSE